MTCGGHGKCSTQQRESLGLRFVLSSNHGLSSDLSNVSVNARVVVTPDVGDCGSWCCLRWVKCALVSLRFCVLLSILLTWF